jgi:lipoprotein-anchoring transpeptidase ErfK/SrfK
VVGAVRAARYWSTDGVTLRARGARAMHLGATVYRIHGTNQPGTIGTKISSGCFRLVNTDVADLHDRVLVGTKVIVRQKPEL